MKRINKLAVLLLTLFPCILQAAPNLAELQATVETRLRSEFNLMDGPATEFVSFHIPDQGYFIMLSTDFGMAGGAHRTPFGTQPATSKVPPSDRIADTLEATILSCKAQLANANADEILAIVIVHRSLFRSPSNDSQQSVVYRSWIQIGNLISEKGKPAFLAQ